MPPASRNRLLKAAALFGGMSARRRSGSRCTLPSKPPWPSSILSRTPPPGDPRSLPWAVLSGVQGRLQRAAEPFGSGTHSIFAGTLFKGGFAAARPGIEAHAPPASRSSCYSSGVVEWTTLTGFGAAAGALIDEFHVCLRDALKLRRKAPCCPRACRRRRAPATWPRCLHSGRKARELRPRRCPSPGPARTPGRRSTEAAKSSRSFTYLWGAKVSRRRLTYARPASWSRSSTRDLDKLGVSPQGCSAQAKYRLAYRSRTSSWM